MLKLSSKIAFFLFSLTFFSVNASADWQLNNNASSFYYVTSKASAVSEVNNFGELSGSIDNSGKATLIIDLSSVDTAVDVRNQRMRDILFQVADFPQAIASLEVDVEALEAMTAGMSVTGSYQLSLDLHGVTESLSADLQVTKLNSNALQVQLAMPLIVNAATFGLADGVEELRELAGLPSINGNVIVGLSLLFVQ
jgi:polyisoprenoid-binding protein YceI